MTRIALTLAVAWVLGAAPARAQEWLAVCPQPGAAWGFVATASTTARPDGLLDWQVALTAVHQDARSYAVTDKVAVPAGLLQAPAAPSLGLVELEDGMLRIFSAQLGAVASAPQASAASAAVQMTWAGKRCDGALVRWPPADAADDGRALLLMEQGGARGVVVMPGRRLRALALELPPPPPKRRRVAAAVGAPAGWRTDAAWQWDVLDVGTLGARPMATAWRTLTLPSRAAGHLSVRSTVVLSDGSLLQWVDGAVADGATWTAWSGILRTRRPG